MSQFSKETICIQSGWKPTKGEPRVLPIIQSTTFKYDTSEAMAKLFDLEPGYMYTRLANPTSDMVAQKITMLEGGVAGVLTSSGQAANFFSLINIMGAGDHFVSAATIYGGTFNLFNVTMRKLGIDVTVALRDVVVDSIMSHMRGNAVKEIHTVTNGDLEIVECIIPSDSKVIGKKLRELSNPGKYLALLDKHPGNEEYEIVTGDTVVSVGDHLVLISSAEDTKKTLEMFGNSSD